MNILRHMEAVFVTEGQPEAYARPYSAPAVSAPAADEPMATVYVTAKRMTPEEKRVSLEQERRAAAGSRT